MLGNSEIIVIKIDPEIYSFKLLSAAEQNHSNLNIKQWCERYHLLGAINAGMFQADYRSNVGYMKNFEHLNNRRISPSYHSVAAFNPKDSLSPSFRIIDTDEEDIQQIINSYQTVIQYLRLIKSLAQNRWSQQDEQARLAAEREAEEQRRREEQARLADPFQGQMVIVRSGTFTMGCTSEQGDECFGDERPAHQVTLGDYYIGKYPVTQAQWNAIVGSNPSHFSGCDDCPVENVSWNDVQEFIRRLNHRTGKNYRLPTEAQWEFAARGGNQSRGF